MCKDNLLIINAMTCKDTSLIINAVTCKEKSTDRKYADVL